MDDSNGHLNTIFIVLIIIAFFMLLSSCCRQLRLAYAEMIASGLNHRRQQMPVVFPNGQSPEVGAPSVCISTIPAVIQNGGEPMYRGYELRVPHRTLGGRLFGGRSTSLPPPSFQTALQNSSPISYVDPDEPPPSYDEYIKAHQPFKGGDKKNDNS